jgi:hypothetical protein
MATRAWVRRLGTGDQYRIERDAEGSITWASGPFHATADTITGPPTNLTERSRGRRGHEPEP